MKYIVALLALQLTVTTLAQAEPPGTRYCALVIKHQFENYECPYSFYIRWRDSQKFERATLQVGEVRRYWLTCRPGDTCEGQLQVQFDSSGEPGEGVEVSRYWLQCISSEKKEGPAAKYVFFFRGTDPALEGTVDSLHIAKRWTVSKWDLAKEEKLFYYFTHPTLMRKTSMPLPKGVPVRNCNPW